jgi:CRP-like cAMP-binding protein
MWMRELEGDGVLPILYKCAETGGIPFIFLTAKTEKTDIRKGMNLGADDYLTKPFDDTDLLNAIEARFRKAAMLQKLYDTSPEGLDSFISDAKKILQLNDLCKDKKVKTFKKKSEIFSDGDTPLNIFLLKSGSVKVFKSNHDGKELITAIHNPNDFFGYEPILEGNVYQESAMAIQDSEIITIPKYDFTMLLQSHPDVSKVFVSILCKKVADREKQLLHLAYNSVRQRTAEALLKAQQLKDDKENIQISREDLSKMVGTAPESVIRVLSDFKDEGLINIENGKIKVIQPAKLERVVRWNVAR